MDQFISFAKKCQEQHIIYEELYIAQKPKKENKPYISKRDIIEPIKNAVPMTLVELNNIGLNIRIEYEAIPQEKINKPIYSEAFDSALSINLDSYYEDQLPSPEIYKNNNCSNISIRNNLPAGQNCQDRFFDCITKIKSLGIHIYRVDKYLKNFKNGNQSSCGGGCEPFIFHCGKNQYQFNIEYSDDCDSHIGLLLVEYAIDINTSIKYNVYADLFNANTNEINSLNFLAFIDSPSYDVFYQIRYGHFTRLPELFEKNNISCKFIGKHKKNIVTVDYNDFEFAYQVDLAKGSVSLIVRNNNKDNEYNVYINTSLDKINEYYSKKYNHTIMGITIFNLYHDDFKTWNLKYQSDDDFPKLLDSINNYLDYTAGNYGYLNTDRQYQNEKIIEQYLNKISTKYQSTSNKYIGSYFDVQSIILGSNSQYPFYPNHLVDVEYLCDQYMVRMWYDEGTNKDQCGFSIQGFYVDLTERSNEYYTNNKNLIMNVKCVAPKFIFMGTFDECFDKLKYFCDQLEFKQENNKPEKRIEKFSKFEKYFLDAFGETNDDELNDV